MRPTFNFFTLTNTSSFRFNFFCCQSNWFFYHFKNEFCPPLRPFYHWVGRSCPVQNRLLAERQKMFSSQHSAFASDFRRTRFSTYSNRVCPRFWKRSVCCHFAQIFRSSCQEKRRMYKSGAFFGRFLCRFTCFLCVDLISFYLLIFFIVRSVQNYTTAHPETVVIDPLDKVEVLIDRYKQYRVILESELAIEGKERE